VLEQDNRHVEMAGVVESAFNEPLALFLLLGAVGGVLAAMVLFFKLQRLTAYSCVAVALLVASFFSYTFYIPSIAIVFLFAVAQLPDRRGKGRALRECFDVRNNGYRGLVF
jgi:cation transport ATPase